MRLLAVTLLVLALSAAPAVAQEPVSGTTTTTLAGVPAPDIIPQPNTDSAPTEAGDRGGALQLALLGLVVVAIGGAAFVIVRQSRRARADESSERAS
jgi:uncharacterized protein HemX